MKKMIFCSILFCASACVDDASVEADKREVFIDTTKSVYPERDLKSLIPKIQIDSTK